MMFSRKISKHKGHEGLKGKILFLFVLGVLCV
jgi:hypothetical protein